MKIRFQKFRLYINLTIGITWIIIGSLSLYDSNFTKWYYFVFMILGILYIGHYLYDLKHQYLTIENGTITKNILYGFKNKIELDEIQQIQKVNGNYILKSETQKMKIKLDLIDNSSLNKLIEVLKNLNLPSERSFLVN